MKSDGKLQVGSWFWVFSLIFDFSAYFNYSFEGFVLNSRHPGPGASEVGLGAAALLPLCVDIALPALNYAG